jgi:hypothetical protein
MNDLASIIKQDVFTEEAMKLSPELLNFLNSQVITTDPRISAKAASAEKGDTIKVPFIQEDLYSESSVIDDTTNEITADSITKNTADMFIGYYAKAWGQFDIVREIGTGKDPVEAAVELYGRYWQKDIQDKMVAILNGAIASNKANESGDNVLTDDVNKFSFDLAVDTLALAGDHMTDFAAIVVHSTTYREILKNDKASLSTVLDSDLGIEREMYNGLELIVTDVMPVITGTPDLVTTVFLRKGAFIYADGQYSKPFATQTNELSGNGGGDTKVVTRKAYGLTLNGYTFTAASVAGVSPTAAELANAANWTRQCDAKLAPFVALESVK